MHTEYTELMSLVLDNEATQEQTAALQAHLKGCLSCDAIWRQWQALDVRLKDAPLLAPAPGLADRVLTRLATQDRRRTSAGWLGAGLLAGWAVVAGFMICLVLLSVWWGVTHPLPASLALSASTHLLSGFLWPMRGAEVILVSAGVSPLAGLVGLGALAGLLLILWLRLAVHPEILAHVHMRGR